MPRQSGYRVTIRGFLPADRKSLEDTAKAVALVQKAIAGTGRGELLDALLSIELDVTSTTRVVADNDPPAPAPEPEPFA